MSRVGSCHVLRAIDVIGARDNSTFIPPCVPVKKLEKVAAADGVSR